MHALPVTIDKARKLTRTSARTCAGLLISLVATLPCLGQAADSSERPQLAALAAAITPQVRRAYPQASTIEVRASTAALQLVPDCQTGLVADVQAQRLHGHLSARVYCATPDGRPGRAARLPVEVLVQVPTLVANAAIPRGALLVAGAMSVREMPLANGGDFLADAAAAIGQRARVSLRAGQAIGARHLEAGDDVTAGQQVALAAGGPDFSVTVAGQALQGGRTGEQIRVRNLATGRVVAAWVTGRGRTHTRPPGNPVASP